MVSQICLTDILPDSRNALIVLALSSVNAFGLHPDLPCCFAESSPALTRSRINSRSIPEKAAQILNNNIPICEDVSNYSPVTQIE